MDYPMMATSRSLHSPTYSDRTPLGLRSDFSEFFLAEVSAKFLIPVEAYPNGVQTETWKERIPVKESLNRLNLSLVISVSLNI